MRARLTTSRCAHAQASTTRVGSRARAPATRGRPLRAFGSETSLFVPPPASASTTTEDARTRSKRIVDAFEALDEDARVALVERMLFGEDGTRAAPELRVEADARVASSARAESSEVDETTDDALDDENAVDGLSAAEAAADLRDFGPAASGEAADQGEALREKWREIFGEDPPERGGASVEEIFNEEDDLVADGLVGEARRVLYGVERSWDKLVYRFGRVGAIIASGFASVGAAVVLSSLFKGSRETEVASPPVEPKDDVEGAVVDSASPSLPLLAASPVRPPSEGGVLWARKDDDEDNDVDDSATSTALNAGILWTRSESREERIPARERFGRPSKTFDDRDRTDDDEPTPRVLWTRKTDPEYDALEGDYAESEPESESWSRPEPRRSEVPLDDNLEDLRAFPRFDRDSPR